MLISYITLFPAMIEGYLSHSILNRKKQNHIWDYRLYHMRDYALDKHKTVDDVPYGGGAGMVIRPDICHYAIDDALKNGQHIIGDDHHYAIIIPSPHGALFTQQSVNMWQQYNHIIFICGRYEGIDERVVDYWHAHLLSVGDYVVMGGEIPALLISETILRKYSNILGNQQSINDDSYDNNLLEYPHYTRPATWQGHAVPDVLLSGHHENIATWRHQQRELLTQQYRPDLWRQYKK